MQAQGIAPDVPPPPAQGNGVENVNGKELTSIWPVTLDLTGGAVPCRLEGEVSDLVTLGEIPKEIDGTFYRTSPCSH